MLRQAPMVGIAFVALVLRARGGLLVGMQDQCRARCPNMPSRTFRRASNKGAPAETWSQCGRQTRRLPASSRPAIAWPGTREEGVVGMRLGARVEAEFVSVGVPRYPVFVAARQARLPHDLLLLVEPRPLVVALPGIFEEVDVASVPASIRVVQVALKVGRVPVSALHQNGSFATLGLCGQQRDGQDACQQGGRAATFRRALGCPLLHLGRTCNHRLCRKIHGSDLMSRLRPCDKGSGENWCLTKEHPRCRRPHHGDSRSPVNNLGGSRPTWAS
mmetsp:Transcript_56585/g.131901  ORF Transcript_56585/g.131901 Transcript_56585/m.131901 type:complete len:274 (+) Transcript_56585:551-1372(+)